MSDALTPEREAAIRDLRYNLAAQDLLAEIDRLRARVVELEGALSRIDYLCGSPNEMQVSLYDVDRHEGRVAEGVELLAKRAADLEATRQAHADIARGVKRGLGLKNWPDMGGKLFQDGVAKLVDALRNRAESAERERDALRTAARVCLSSMSGHSPSCRRHWERLRHWEPPACTCGYGTLSELVKETDHAD